MRTRLLVAAVAATASLAACGAEAPASGVDGREAANRKAMLDLARCMRENGVNMPDPQFETGGRVIQRGGPGKVDAATLRKADKACAKYRESIKAPELSD